MITFLICIISGIITGYYIMTRTMKKDERCWGDYFTSYAVGFIGGFLLWLFVNLCLYHFIFVEHIQTKYDIVSISDGTNLNGSFVLGCGTIKEESYYYYYQKEITGGYTQHKVLTKQTTIFEDANEYPFVILYNVQSSDNRFAIPFGKCPYITAEIHVPAGTIIKQFKLDLE